jgi:hypothetical protein
MFRRNSPAIIPSASPGHDRREGTGEATPHERRGRCSRGEFEPVSSPSALPAR